MKTCGSCFRYCENCWDAKAKGLKPLRQGGFDEYFRRPRLGVMPSAIGLTCPRGAALRPDRPSCEHHQYRWARNIGIWWEWHFKYGVTRWFSKYIRVPLGSLRKPLSLVWEPSFDGIADCIIPNGEPRCPYCGEMPYSREQCVFCGQRFLPDESKLEGYTIETVICDELIGFIDGICPECGKSCGNGGRGPLRCSCGWKGEVLSEEAQKAIDELFDEEFEGGRAN